MEPETNKKEMSMSEKKNFFKFRISPARHFKKLMIVSFLAFVGIVAFHGYLFYNVKFFDAKRNSAGEVLPIPAINQDKLETVLSVYGARARSQERITSVSTPVVDPSK